MGPSRACREDARITVVAETEATVATMHEQHLLLADRHIAEAEARVTRQRVLIDELARDSHDTVLAEALLATLLTALDRDVGPAQPSSAGRGRAGQAALP